MEGVKKYKMKCHWMSSKHTHIAKDEATHILSCLYLHPLRNIIINKCERKKNCTRFSISQQCLDVKSNSSPIRSSAVCSIYGTIQCT